MRFVFLILLLLPTWVWSEAVESLDKVVAVVNDNVITEHELTSQTELMRHQLEAKKVSMPPEQVLRKQVLQHLIDVDLQLQLAKNNDVTVDAAELDTAIENIAAENHLTLDQLRAALAQQGMTWDMYRESLRKEMLMARMQQKAINADLDVTSQQVNDYLKTAVEQEKVNQVFHVQNIVIPLPEEPTSQQVTKAHAKAMTLLAKIKQGEDFGLLAVAESSDEYALEGGDLGERHLAELPEIFAKEVVAMQAGQVSGPIRTGNGFQLIKLLAVNTNEPHHEITKTHVRHILLKQDVNMTDTEALKQAKNLYEQLKSGKDFALMAKQYSLDPGSASKGGDLGWVVPDELVKPFAEAMNALALNTVSKPVKSQFGWHLIEVLERKTMDDSAAYKRQQVRLLLQRRKFNEAVQNWQQHIRSQSYVKIFDKHLT